MAFSYSILNVLACYISAYCQVINSEICCRLDKASFHTGINLMSSLVLQVQIQRLLIIILQIVLWSKLQVRLLMEIAGNQNIYMMILIRRRLWRRWVWLKKKLKC